jgi:hypothetical protein
MRWGGTVSIGRGGRGMRAPFVAGRGGAEKTTND